MDTFENLLPSSTLVSIQSCVENQMVIYSFVYFRSALRGSEKKNFYFYFTTVKGSVEFAKTQLAENLSRNIQKVVFVNSKLFLLL